MTRNRGWIVTMAVLLMAAAGSMAQAHCGGCAVDKGAKVEAVGQAQTECPIMGGEIDREVYLDHGGKRVYFCCTGCIDDFKESPEKYLKKMAKDGVVLEDAPHAEKKAKKKGGCPHSH